MMSLLQLSETYNNNTTELVLHSAPKKKILKMNKNHNQHFFPDMKKNMNNKTLRLA